MAIMMLLGLRLSLFIFFWPFFSLFSKMFRYGTTKIIICYKKGNLAGNSYFENI